MELLQELVTAQTEGEAGVQAVISSRLAALGCTVEVVDYDPAEVSVKGEFARKSARAVERRKAVVGTLEGDPSLPSLLMFAHPDGEPVGDISQWQHPPFVGEVEDGKLYG